MKITYIQHDGTSQIVDVPAGVSVMEGAMRNNVPGIDAECGGTCSCGTCHIHVDATWLSRLEAPASIELEMLEFIEGAADDSRLSCQIVVTAAVDGLVLTIPREQG